MQGSLRSVLGALVLATFVSAGAASAQTQTGEIYGKVTDQSGAVMPGTTVTLTSPALLQPQSTIAAASGSYRFPNLQIGVYAVTFELTGFKRVIRTEVRIQAGFNAEVNGRLEL